MNKTAGEYSPRMEWLADRYRLITFSKHAEKAMAREGFPGEISFISGQAVFFPEEMTLGAVVAEGEHEIDSLRNLIHKLLTHTLSEYRLFSKKEN